ncbi:MAG: hypothetical protein ACM3PT_11650 [Deltaproteobacteria bacterium]
MQYLFSPTLLNYYRYAFGIISFFIRFNPLKQAAIKYYGMEEMF